MTTLSTMPPNNLLPPSNNNKRKRESSDVLDGSRSRKSQNTNGDVGDENDEELHLQLLQGIGQEALQEQDDSNARTAQAALSTGMPQNTYPPPENSFDNATGMPQGLSSFDDSSNSPPTGFSAITPSQQALMAAREATTTNHNKPAVGTQQWHQQRKDNHKEGETETILCVDRVEGLTDQQLSDVAAKPSMKASMSLQKSFLGPTRTKARFCNLPWLTLPSS